MPPPLLFDLDTIDLDQRILTAEEIYDLLPHRYEFKLLDGVVHKNSDEKSIITYRDTTHDDWWWRGHVPGRPLLPGVLMLEMAGQSSAVMVKLFGGTDAFIGFGGVDKCKFRESVNPGSRLYILAQTTEIRSRRIVSHVQGVVDRRLIFEADIIGVVMR